MANNHNHPKKGSTTKVDPITRIRDINKLKSILNPRDLCLFTLGINTALRASDLIRIKVNQVKDVEPMGEAEIKEKKETKYKRMNLNSACVESIQAYLNTRNDDSEWLFPNGQGSHLSVPYVSNLVKGWCSRIGLRGNFASHTLRKTFGYIQRTKYDVRVPILMKVFNHSSERQTLEYLCIQPQEIKEIYQNVI